MAFRLELYKFDCRANMPTRYGRDLRCRACGPGYGQQQQEEHIEDQDHLEVCREYSELWEGLEPASPESRIQYCMRVKMKCSSSSRTNNSRKVYNSSSSSRPKRVVQTVELEARKWIIS